MDGRSCPSLLFGAPRGGLCQRPRHWSVASLRGTEDGSTEPFGQSGEENEGSGSSLIRNLFEGEQPILVRIKLAKERLPKVGRRRSGAMIGMRVSAGRVPGTNRDFLRVHDASCPGRRPWLVEDTLEFRHFNAATHIPIEIFKGFSELPVELGCVRHAALAHGRHCSLRLRSRLFCCFGTEVWLDFRRALPVRLRSTCYTLTDFYCSVRNRVSLLDDTYLHLSIAQWARTSQILLSNPGSNPWVTARKSNRKRTNSQPPIRPTYPRKKPRRLELPHRGSDTPGATGTIPRLQSPGSSLV